MLNGPRVKRGNTKKNGISRSTYGKVSVGLAKSRATWNRCTTDSSEVLSPFSSLLKDSNQPKAASPFGKSTTVPKLPLSPLVESNVSKCNETPSAKLPYQSHCRDITSTPLASVPADTNYSSDVDLTSDRESPLSCSSDAQQHSPCDREQENVCLNFSSCSTPSPVSLVLSSGHKTSTWSVNATVGSRTSLNTTPSLLATSFEQRSCQRAHHHLTHCSREISSLCESLADCSIRNQSPTPSTPVSSVSSPLLHYLSPVHSIPVSDKEKVLSLCNQREPLPLQDFFFTDTMVRTLTKLGEGTFAEVFGCSDDGNQLALKIVPIEGEIEYNGERQSSFGDILPEMVVSRELSMLGDQGNKENGALNFTNSFLQVHRMSLCCGQFPQFLLDVWDQHDAKHSSENDRPDIFPSGQLYIVFCADDAGIPLDEFTYSSFDEAKSIINQVAATLAVGEAALEFEHRDLHQGNILIKQTKEKSVSFRLNGQDIVIETHGVLVTIVDYTLSRICQGSCVSYNDLNKLEWLFTAKGDIQFDVYRQMRDHTKCNWQSYCPYTNVLWLHYVLVKISQRSKLNKRITLRAWRASFRGLIRDIFNHSTAAEVLFDLILPTLLNV